MVEYNDQLRLVHIRGDLLRRFTLRDAGTRTARVRAAIKIEAVLDQHTLITQQADTCCRKECVHFRTAGFWRALTECETCQNRFFDIVVSVACVNTVSGFDAAQDFCHARRLLHRFPFVVKNISGDHHQIRVFGIDLLNHLFHLPQTDIVSQMQV